MKEKQPMADKLKRLKRGHSFTVSSEAERQTVCRIVKALRDAGYLPHKIITKKEGDAFKVAAI